MGRNPRRLRPQIVANQKVDTTEMGCINWLKVEKRIHFYSPYKPEHVPLLFEKNFYRRECSHEYAPNQNQYIAYGQDILFLGLHCHFYPSESTCLMCWHRLAVRYGLYFRPEYNVPLFHEYRLRSVG